LEFVTLVILRAMAYAWRGELKRKFPSPIGRGVRGEGSFIFKEATMKKFLVLGLVALLTAFGAVATARAEAPNTQPATARYINGQPQSIPANSATWYKFDYAGDKSQVTVLMPNGANTLIAFNVYTPEQAQSWWDAKTKPIGRGTAYQIDCATGEENYMGQCQSNDLKWVGKFNFPGTFYVQVVNYNTGTANFTLTIQGTGVSVGAAPTVVTPQQPLLPVTGGVWENVPPQFRMRFWWKEP
jgi:hypothetical protein